MIQHALVDRNHLIKLVNGFSIDPKSDLPAHIQRASQLARHLLERAATLQTPQEKRQQHEFERMMQSDTDKATLIQMTDQAFRSTRARRAAEQLTHILDVQGVPRFFGAFDRAMLRGFQSFGSYLPGVSIPMVKDKMRAETANVILPAETHLLKQHLSNRRDHGVRMNVNYLGEALLGEDEAKRRLEKYLAALQIPEIEVLSVKVSTIYSQISSISRERAIQILCDRMELLYRAALRSRFVRASGVEVPKFVYLDMEEYRDLSITVETFIRTLERPGLKNASAGIALQAYLPDSFAVQKKITEWAKERVADGGAPVTIRIVKGANMEMERVEASLHGWEQAPFNDKVDTDACYKLMVEYGLRPENAQAVHIGIASHNLFDVSYALILTAERELWDQVQFEMLEGMANHQRRALSECASNILLYAPATHQEDFVNAIGYLIRRLDENTGEDNFLRHTFKLELDSDEWRRLLDGFVESVRRMEALKLGPRRQQNRQLPVPRQPDDAKTGTFDNEADTDFTLPANYAWAKDILVRWSKRCGENAPLIPLHIAGSEVKNERTLKTCDDPSRPGVIVGRYAQANLDDIDRALHCAATDPSGWRSTSISHRSEVLRRVAHEIRRHRADLMGAALADGGKLLTESDPEVSEAIDFVNYYAATARMYEDLTTVQSRPKGVVVVVPPWNFPIAIPCGGIAAALAAGNTVILKPASNTVLVAYELCECFWRAGIPKEVLQCVPCSGSTGGARLVASDQTDVVILTGGTDTAVRMLDARPDMMLLAETGGKNATIVTAMSDRELAIAHVLKSAFGHSGQKCSATSLLILEDEVYEDESFRRTLVDAVASMKVGTAWSLDTKMGPMVQPPSGDLERALKELEPGETWALMPRQIDNNPCLYSPGIKWGVTPASYTHMTEFFGPVLGVMRCKDLYEAIHYVNQTGYGLTSGLQSLDEREQAIWRNSIKAGNLYINRGTTGAIVLRQPFGGMGKSAFGPGIKAGGPNYVAQLLDFEDIHNDVDLSDAPLQSDELKALRTDLLSRHRPGALPSDLVRLLQAMVSYERAYDDEFRREHDSFKLVGQDNIRRYLPVENLRIRIHPDDSAFEIFARVCAARVVGCRTTVSVPPDQQPPMVQLLDELTVTWGAYVEFVEETDDALAQIIRQGRTDRVRYAKPGRVSETVLRAVGESGVFIAQSPVLIEGRIELMWYQKEQSISFDYHRYGNLGARSGEPRKPVN